ncbi:MAG: aromatic ring-opening dioxygenase subunit LigA [Gammaproteobacteria bacterium]|nr:aromatic ring-opening dioxygenase subunit LigA [Gammaproteobacteria bacterium]
MSLYYVQKLLYQLNRDDRTRERYENNFEELINEYDLVDEELEAIRGADIGLLYVMGVNGQLLMHFAALKGLPWDEYIQAMRDGLAEHGEVRTGFYATTDGKGAL